MVNEDKRQLLHLGMIVFALLLRWLTRWQAITLAGAALIFNIFILVKIAPELFREQEQKKGFSIGIVMYPLVVLILVSMFPLYIAAGGWAILAVGDSLSNIVGRHFGKQKLVWNRDKSYLGSSAFILSSIPSCAFFLWWVKPQLAIVALAILAIASSVIGGILETLPVKIDDNILVGLGGGISLFLFSLLFGI